MNILIIKRLAHQVTPAQLAHPHVLLVTLIAKHQQEVIALL
jgi:hypothetical protein